ncbi:hypothetical protein K3495_g11893 [Podosphaera aphanis]|nr:hypothetical protein K3495_g11893 [Podosphaera aphanis]
MTDHIDVEVENFQKRVAQAKLVLSRFCSLLDATGDEEIRRSTEIAAAGLLDQLTNILSGRKNTQSVASCLPIPERPEQTRAQNATPPVPQVSGAHALRKPSSTQLPTHPPAGKQANTRARLSTAQTIAPTSTAGPPQIEGPWTKVTHRKLDKFQQVKITQQVTTELLQTWPGPKVKKSPAPRPDERLFLRLREGHPWRSMSPYYVKLSLAIKLRVANSAIHQVTVVNSGFTITAANEAPRSRLLEEAHRLQREENEMEGTT